MMKNSKFFLVCVIVALIITCAMECGKNVQLNRKKVAEHLRDSLVIDSMRSYYSGDTLEYVEHAGIPYDDTKSN